MLWSQAIGKTVGDRLCLKIRPKCAFTSNLHQDYCTILYQYHIWASVKLAVRLNPCITFPWPCQRGSQGTLWPLAAGGAQAATATRGCSGSRSLPGQKQALEQGWNSGM